MRTPNYDYTQYARGRDGNQGMRRGDAPHTRDLEIWHTRNHGKVDRWLPQALSGHGVFNTYLFAIGKAPTENCYFCGEEDTRRHAIFEYPACANLRKAAQGASNSVDAKNLVARMVSSEDEWHRYGQMLMAIMMRREDREKQEKKEREQPEGQHEVM
ncbi:uncharacterized protein [Maniola hyperantus]|uniref:uncharacterized protein n=1 Tax=Aphantopus hyperantus TaxID=2795564 RepID=UPI0037488EBA